MIKPRFAIKLAGAKFRSKKIASVSSAITASLLFAVAIAGIRIVEHEGIQHAQRPIQNDGLTHAHGHLAGLARHRR